MRCLATFMWLFIPSLVVLILNRDHVECRPYRPGLVATDGVKLKNSRDVITSPLTVNFDKGLHGRIMFGAQTLDVLIEIGWHTTWVCSAECTTCDGTLDKYNKSTPGVYYYDMMKPYSTKLADEADDTVMSGTLALTSVSIAGAKINYQMFGLISQQKGKRRIETYDGRIGISPGAFEMSRYPSIVDYAYAQDLIPQRLYAIWMSKKDSSGELMLGSPDASRFTGSITYVPQVGDLNKWRIQVDQVSATVKSKKTLVCASGCNAVFSSRSFRIYGPQKDIASFHNLIGAKLVNESYKFDCALNTTLPNIVFKISGKDFPVAPSEYIFQVENNCRTYLFGWDDSVWQFGYPFLRSYYTVFDLKNKLIGLAAPKGSK